MTPDDMELHRVMLSECCAGPSPHISLICKALTTVSHGQDRLTNPALERQGRRAEMRAIPGGEPAKTAAVALDWNVKL
jgi:hypothetical protein